VNDLVQNRVQVIVIISAECSDSAITVYLAGASVSCLTNQALPWIMRVHSGLKQRNTFSNIAYDALLLSVQLATQRQHFRARKWNHQKISRGRCVYKNMKAKWNCNLLSISRNWVYIRSGYDQLITITDVHILLVRRICYVNKTIRESQVFKRHPCFKCLDITLSTVAIVILRFSRHIFVLGRFRVQISGRMFHVDFFGCSRKMLVYYIKTGYDRFFHSLFNSLLTNDAP